MSGTTDPAAPAGGPRRVRARAAAAPKRAARKKAPRRRVPIRWSAAREEIFLATLAQVANVAAASRASGLSDTSVYRRRRDDADFRARWTAALREGFARLETMMLERALGGVEKPVWYGGKQVGTVTEYNDRMALALLAAHRGTVTGAEPASDVPLDELRDRWRQRLTEMNERMGGAG